VCVLTVSYTHLSVNLNLSSRRAMEGDSMQATCDVHNFEQKRILLVWIRKTPSDNHEVEIATNEYVNQNFRHSGRYNSSVELVVPQSYQRVLFRLHILSKYFNRAQFVILNYG